MRYLRRGSGDRFHYRRGIPEDLRAVIGAREWKKTFRASSPRQAEIQARSLAAEHDALIAEHRENGPLALANLNVEILRRHLSDAYRTGVPFVGLEVAYRNAQESRLAKLDKAVVGGAKSWADAKSDRLRLPMLQAELQLLELARDGQTRESFSDCELGIYELIAKPTFSEQLNFTRDPSPLLDRFTAKKLRDRILTLRTEIESCKARELSRSALHPLLGLEPIATPVLHNPNNPLLLSAFEDWLEDEKQSHDTSRKYRVYVRRLAEHIGNLPVRDIKKGQIKEFLKFLTKLPDSNRVRPSLRRTCSMPELIRMREAWFEQNSDAEPDDWPLITAATANKHLECYRALLDWVVSDQDDFVNVALDVRRTKDERSRSEIDIRAFHADELRAVFEAADKLWPPQTDMWWLVRLGAYTGARLEEMCQLARCNVLEMRGIPVIEINDGSFSERGQRVQRKIKNAMSERQIPLHPKLIELGFLDFAKTGSGERIFSTFKRSGGRYGHNPSKAFHRLLRQTLGISDRRVRFHSFRHGFITALHNAGVTQVQVNALAGHSRAKGPAGKYIDPLQTAVLLKAVKKLRII